MTNMNSCSRGGKRSPGLGMSVKAAYAFVRNPEPTKMSSLSVNCGLTSNPNLVEKTLNEFWVAKETWPENLTREVALENLDQRYAFLLPNVPFDAELTTRHLVWVVKHARDSATGLDAWSLRGLKLLPENAWASLLDILTTRFHLIGASLSGLVKRAPLEKVTGENGVANVRPIDLFSAIVRVYTPRLCST